ncbi:13343_t:CDS:2, partial [Racocetra fulgida]
QCQMYSLDYYRSKTICAKYSARGKNFIDTGIVSDTIHGSRNFTNDAMYLLHVPGYICQSEALRSNICKSSSEAITSTYQQAFFSKTRFDGLLVMGFDNSEICKALLTDIYFHPYTFKIGNIINLNVFGIGKSNNPNWKYAGKGYQSSFVYNFRKTRALFFQEFSNKEAIVKIYQNSQEIYVFRNTDPNTVWNQIGILTQFTGCTLFGLEHEQTKSEINNEQTLTCTVEDWQ